MTCWGKPASGTQIPGGRFSKISVAGGACGVTDRGEVRCWGVPDVWHPPAGAFVDVAITSFNAYAVAADGTLVVRGTAPDRRAAGAVRVAAMDCQACVTTRGGDVDCRNDNGKASHVAGPLKSFAPACSGGCGLRPDGSIVCVPEVRLPPPPAVAAERFAEIASTRDRFCATSSRGRVTC
jgi:hypothetical protein